MMCKSVDDNFYLGKKLDTRYYRSLSKYKQDNDSNNICLRERFSNNGVNERRDIFNDKKVVRKKNQQLIRSSLNNAQYFTEILDYNKGMFDGKHFHFEKKWIKKKGYDYFLERNKRICDIALKKLRFRKYRIGVAMFLIFLLLGIGIPILSKLSFFKDIWDKITQDSLWNTFKKFIDPLIKGKEFYIFIALFSVLMTMLSIMLIIVTYKILRNNEKYNKIKLIREQNE
ncbi:Plasmodium exported protein (Pm-fam-a like), unknown function [Plasmodium malariae]|uniref:Fam-m protein n=1 Tax=Plasmodium malariae TaxID=5858 RepID=A0A1A8WTD4_PLAMA|nr:Plasmodium exported protein (Pm-fam-a like), unknown function [Plasmodium malariae]